MVFEDKFRSFVRFFWVLPLVAAPSLILWGYYEAHRANVMTFEEARSLHRTQGTEVGCLTSEAFVNQQCNTSQVVPRGLTRVKHPQMTSDPRNEQQTVNSEGAIEDTDRHEQRVVELEAKARKLERKIKERKKMLAKLKEETESSNSEAVSTKICETKKLAPLNSRPIVSLASAPGSGNTWVRHLLESATGIYTGSIYSDKRLYRAGFFGEYEDPWSGTLLVVKSHKFKADVAKKYDTAIVLVRNPYKALISEYNRLLTGKNHTAVANQADFSGPEWERFVRAMGDKWLLIIEKWLAKDPDIHITYYEDVITNTRTELEKMLKFLNVDVDTARMDCTIANQEGSFHRKSSNSFDPFTREQKVYLDQKIKRARTVISENHKPALPDDYSADVLR